MKKYLVIILSVVTIFSIVRLQNPKHGAPDTAPETSCVGMSLVEAIQIAELGCGEAGILTGAISCNATTHTRWIDIMPNKPKSNCNPACVVDVNTKATEINRRCMGLISE